MQEATRRDMSARKRPRDADLPRLNRGAHDLTRWRRATICGMVTLPFRAPRPPTLLGPQTQHFLYRLSKLLLPRENFKTPDSGFQPNARRPSSQQPAAGRARPERPNGCFCRQGVAGRAAPRRGPKHQRDPTSALESKARGESPPATTLMGENREFRPSNFRDGYKSAAPRPASNQKAPPSRAFLSSGGGI
jgi:hypothetical protein